MGKTSSPNIVPYFITVINCDGIGSTCMYINVVVAAVVVLVVVASSFFVVKVCWLLLVPNSLSSSQKIYIRQISFISSSLFMLNVIGREANVRHFCTVTIRATPRIYKNVPNYMLVCFDRMFHARISV